MFSTVPGKKNKKGAIAKAYPDLYYAILFVKIFARVQR